MSKYKLMCKRVELQLMGTLNGGQCFRWRKTQVNGTDRWMGVFSNKVWILEQHEDYVGYQVYEEEVHEKESKTVEETHYEEILRKYFQLDLINLEEHYSKWSSQDVYFKKAAEQFYGIRILQQDPIENIFSFICSQNNHISRISSLVEKLATGYGKKICEIDGVPYYGFPKVEFLADPKVEQELRTNGFGYRAKYINKSAQQIVDNGGKMWIEKLKNMNYQEAKRELITLTGIGPKVADCICLMSLGHLEAIPVDTHMYNIAARFYMPKLAKQKSVTEKIYTEIGDYFRNMYGPLAGWAHTILFCADLKMFKINKNEEGEKKNIKRKKT